MTHRMLRLAAVLAAACLLAVAPAHARKFRYSSGPEPAPADTALAVAQTEIDPVVRERGPVVAPTNLELITLAANAALERTLAAAPLDSGTHVVLAPAESHPLNFVLEQAALRALTGDGLSATVRRTVIPDDSLATAAASRGDPVLEYQLATARVTYLRLIGGFVLPSRTKVERQAMVSGRLTLRDPASARVLWVADADHNFLDRFPRDQLPRVEDPRYVELKAELPQRNFGRVIEPVVVAGVVTGLVLLFFQNRP